MRAMRSQGLLVHSQQFSDPRRAPHARRATGRAERIQLRTRHLGSFAFALLVTAALIVGYLAREEDHITPEHGIGYWLGIAGATMMLLLLLYPARKRWQKLAGLGSVRAWFRIHMALGVLGPALILFHSNFKLGSTNSNVALISMLVVAGSGIAGRYLYSRVHMGLYGRRANAMDLLDQVEDMQRALLDGESIPASLRARLQDYGQAALNGSAGAVPSLLAILRLNLFFWRRRDLEARMEHLIVKACRRRRMSWWQRRAHIIGMRRAMRRYFSAVSKAASYKFYERMFALWHVLHLPLFILLIMTGIAHVIAVHLY